MDTKNKHNTSNHTKNSELGKFKLFYELAIPVDPARQRHERRR